MNKMFLKSPHGILHTYFCEFTIGRGNFLTLFQYGVKLHHHITFNVLYVYESYICNEL